VTFGYVNNKEEFFMAEIRTTLSEQERLQSSDPSTVNRYEPAPSMSASPVGVYERPADATRSSGGVIGSIVMLLLLLLVAYLLFQWLF
jgi:hypothetical protein